MTRILYLHGFASSPSSSKARYFRDRLESAGMAVEIPDLADGDFENLTLSGQLALVERCARKETVSLVGSSMGGYVAALYAARHPAAVLRLVLLAPGFDFARRWAELTGPAELERWRREGVMDVYHYGENRNRKLRYLLLEDAAQFEPWPDFRQPALIFHGAHDDVVPAAYSEQFAAGHPNARLEILDSGHELLNVLDNMAPKVVDFLGG